MLRTSGDSRPTSIGQVSEHSAREAAAPRSRVWTNSHSFFAVSGGFAFDTTNLPENEQFLPGSRDRVTLTPDALLEVAKYDLSLIPSISSAEINDKSKADALAKGIVCIQAAWFLVETIARLSQHLPISLLELNTFAHALCALIIYSLWWDKPFGVEEPALIEGNRMHKICCALCYSSKFDGIRDSARNRIGGAPINARRWALEAVEYRRELDLLKDRIRNSPPFDHFDEAGAVFFDYGGDAFSIHDYREGITLLLAFTLAGMAYGALHLVAWNYPFPSSTQHILWKISGFAVAASGPAFLLIGLAFGAFNYTIWYKPHKKNGTLLFHVLIWVVGLALFFSCLFYLFARVNLVVGCFLTFPYPPDAVFEQPAWSYYVPTYHRNYYIQQISISSLTSSPKYAL